MAFFRSRVDAMDCSPFWAVARLPHRTVRRARTPAAYLSAGMASESAALICCSPMSMLRSSMANGHSGCCPSRLPGTIQLFPSANLFQMIIERIDDGCRVDRRSRSRMVDPLLTALHRDGPWKTTIDRSAICVAATVSPSLLASTTTN